MLSGFNIEHSDAALLFTQAIRTSPKFPLTRSFDLADLGRHNILEHDISLRCAIPLIRLLGPVLILTISSRSDAFFADANPFNETIWAETVKCFPDDMITVQQLANARMGRLATSERTNPKYSLSKLADGFSWGECAAFFEIMADGTTGTVAKKYIEYWLSMLPSFVDLFGSRLTRTSAVENERMPTEIGWQRRTKTMRGTERIAFTRKLMQAAGVSMKRDAYGRELAE